MGNTQWHRARTFRQAGTVRKAAFEALESRVLMSVAPHGVTTHDVPAGTASISGVVFNDADGSGTQDTGENGLAGVTVFLDASNSGVYQSGDPTRQTDAAGNYIFSTLAAGNYTVGEILPVGESQTLPGGNANIAVAVADGQVVTGQNFGVTGVPTAAAGTIAGTVFTDANVNGLQDAGETGVAGVVVYIDVNNAGQFQPGDPMATTDSQGNYAIPGLTNDTNELRITLPAGYTQTAPLNNDGIRVTFTGGTGAGGQDFGLLPSPPPPASISGTVYDDVNSDGMQGEGENGVEGVTVYIDANNTGSYVSTDPSAVTNAQGAYTFGGLTLGNYTVRVNVPNGDLQTAPVQGAANQVSVVYGQAFVGADFGVYVPPVVQPTTATFSGTVYNDANHDGVQDNGEVGVGNVRVYLDPNYSHSWNGAIEPSAVTDASGDYSISTVLADPEILRVVLPSGAQQSFPAGGIGQYVGKNTGQTVSNINFGIYTPAVVSTATITGSVFNDANGDHVQGSGEANVANATVYIDANNDGIFDAGDPNTVTTASGTFTFSGLAAGTYTVYVAPSAGYRQTLPIVGGTKVTVAAGKTASAGKFGVTNTAYVGGTLFNDTNGNGVQDSGEGVISGWTVYLDLNNDGKRESNEPAAVSTTTSVGYWYFRAVAPGTYTIRAVAATGYTLTKVYTVNLASGVMVTNGSIGAKK